MEDNIHVKFPKGLLFWAGHRDGGVKKPFIDSSGRPTGEIIRTHILDKIDSWIQSLIDPNSHTHRALLLIGGPGNGKTEAVEYFIEKYDEQLGASGALIDKFKTGFTPVPGNLPPRKVTINLHDIPGIIKGKYRKLEIVHDATVSEVGASPESLLINDIGAVNDEDELIYISCINRGILSQTIEKVSSSAGNEAIKDLLIAVLKAVTLSPEQPPCWPLRDYLNFAAWPMDVESLVDETTYVGGITPAYQIFKTALDRALWIAPDKCQAGKYCPFHSNLEILSNDIVLRNLVKILRNYEISSGKRWTFRELFSLVPFLLVGHENDFKLKGKDIDPCEWAANHLKTIQASSDAFEKTKSRFLLSSKIYYHALFPRWPDLKTVRNDCKQVLKKDPSNGANINDLFRLLRWIKKDSSTDINKLINEQFGYLLDPVEIFGGLIMAGDCLSADNIEEMFSYSIKLGYSNVREFLSDSEQPLLEWLVLVEDSIEEDALKGNKNYARLYDELRKNLRLFASRVVKRSLAVKKGLTKDNLYLERYAKAIDQVIELKNVRKQFRDLIHVNSRFNISLSTTFGQPVPQPDQDALLNTQMVKVTYILPQRSEQHAQSSLPYLKIKDHPIPLTYSLFKSLVELNDGLMQASIPIDNLALIEGTRSRIAGEIVRDIEGLDDATLTIGNRIYSLIIYGGKIRVQEQRR